MIKSLVKFFLDLLKLLYFLILLIFSFPRGRLKKSRRQVDLEILANGPSLKDKIKVLRQHDIYKNDYLVMNYFALDDLFIKLKPTYYCFADPMFYKKTLRFEEVMSLFKIINETVAWPMTIYIPSSKYRAFKSFYKFENSFLTIVPVNNLPYRGPENLRNYFYSKGLAQPQSFTVANFAIYIGLMLGYNKIELYGVDHTFFEGLAVDENNQVCNIEKHFYGKSDNLRPIININTGLNWSIANYTFNISHMFKSHDYLNSLASYMNIQVINHTCNSLIDSYPRFKK